MAVVAFEELPEAAELLSRTRDPADAVKIKHSDRIFAQLHHLSVARERSMVVNTLRNTCG